MTNTFKYLFVMIAMTAFTSCVNRWKYQSPENAAMPGFPLPLYDNISQWMDGKRMSTLQPGTLVYMMYDTIMDGWVDPQPALMRITWGDSVAFCPINGLIPQGRLAVVTSNKSNEVIKVYADPELKNVVSTFNTTWTTFVVGETIGKGRKTLYVGPDGHYGGGYVSDALTYDDPLNIEFYKAYTEAGRQYKSGDTMAIASLLKLKKYAKLKTYHRLKKLVDAGEGFHSDNFGDVGIDYTSEKRLRATESNWSVLGEELAEADRPSIIKKFFVFDDGTEADATGWDLKNGYPSKGDASNNKKVDRIRFEVTPTRVVDILASVDIFYAPESRHNTAFSTWIPAKPGEPYSVWVENNSVTMCSVVRARFVVREGDSEAAYPTAVATIFGSCEKSQ